MSLSLAEHDLDSATLASLIARSRANVARSRSLRDQARVIVARSARLRPTPIMGASDAAGPNSLGTSPTSIEHPRPGVFDSQSRRSVVVLAHDPLMRALVADAIRRHHEIIEASDASSALKAVTAGIRVDVVIAGCFTFGDSRALELCGATARQLYDSCPWIPIVVIADAAPPLLKADVLLTGVRTFLPQDFAASDLLAAVARVGRRPEAVMPTSSHMAAIKQTFAVLEQMLTDVPPLAELAAMVAMSRSHFSRTFHAVAGISLRDYVRDLRLKHAQQLMRSSRLSLSAIATEAGFYDLPHFNKAFRHRFGMSPTQFRVALLSLPSPSTT